MQTRATTALVLSFLAPFALAQNLVSVNVDDATTASGKTEGEVRLTSAPTADLVVTLSSTSAKVTVPGTVTVKAGTDRAAFAVSYGTATDDIEDYASIKASVGSQMVATEISLPSASTSFDASAAISGDRAVVTFGTPGSDSGLVFDVYRRSGAVVRRVGVMVVPEGVFVDSYVPAGTVEYRLVARTPSHSAQASTAWVVATRATTVVTPTVTLPTGTLSDTVTVGLTTPTGINIEEAMLIVDGREVFVSVPSENSTSCPLAVDTRSLANGAHTAVATASVNGLWHTCAPLSFTTSNIVTEVKTSEIWDGGRADPWLYRA